MKERIDKVVEILARKGYRSVSEMTVRQFRFTRAFLGAVGINLQEGFTQSNIDEVPVKKQVAAYARQVIVLADSAKVNRDVLVLFLRLDLVHAVITDSGIMPEDRAALEDKGIQVLTAEQGGGL
jgi:DeoR family fructose operon transcriptional repressor